MTRLDRVAAVLGVALFGGQVQADPASCAPDRVTALVEGAPAVFTVEIADDDAERARGLMFREEMAIDRGMIFLYPEEAPRAFWMKNTFIPLDIIFFDATGRVIHVAANTVPFSTRSIPSRGPALGALEINGGLAATLGIAPGTLLRHPAFAETAPPESRCP